MLTSLSRFIAPLLLCLPVLAQDPPADPCDRAVPCTANLTWTGNGQLPLSTALYVNNVTKANGSGWWTGATCRTCTNCRGQYRVVWDGGGTHCIEQHPCDLLGDSSGSMTVGMFASCGSVDQDQYELGPCNSGWQPSDCPTPPLASVSFAIVVKLTCNSCTE